VFQYGKFPGVRIVENTGDFYSLNVGSIPARRTKDFIASETWKSESPYKTFRARLAFLSGFNSHRWYQFIIKNYGNDMLMNILLIGNTERVLNKLNRAGSLVS